MLYRRAMTNTRTPAGYTITPVTAEDGYRTYRVFAPTTGGWAETAYRREAVAAAIAHARTGNWNGWTR